MKIIILGAGQVGSTLAENLDGEGNDITVVDIDNDRLRELQVKLDIRTVHGKATFPSVLKDAGADDADIVIAVTDSDEVNMVACQVSYTLFRTPKKVARIRESSYLKQTGLFNDDAFPVDHLINPEKLLTQHISRLIEHPGALDVLDFAGGKVQIVAVKAYEGGPLVNQELQRIKEHMPSIDIRVAAIYRKNTSIQPTGKTIIEVDDEVFFIADRKHIRAVMSELRKLDRGYKKIFIVGGGNIGLKLAAAIEDRYNVKIIEKDKNRCRILSRELNKAIVFHGNASDRDLLVEEAVDETDIFISLTNNDEANLMASLLARSLGAKKVMALINNTAYVDLLQGESIDIVISPQQTTISSLLRLVRKGDVVAVHSLRRGAAEAIEAIVHGDESESKIIGKRLGDIALPKGTTIGALVRNDKVLIAHDYLVIMPDDHVILFLINKKRFHEVERLFQVDVGFF